ncbi:hypothetical protein GCM10009854_42290 [Saccharopolyspora halophila]|uniref:ABC-type glycine betaine transport system substrate-binding domain-containing protein n=1 Tax=Saccharopolyspora halophila TaxID=405551 RepID=A0ABP5TQQ2_9PSEU
MVRSGSRRPTALLAALAALVLLAAGCGGQNAPDRHIKIGYIAWDEDVAVTYLVKHLLEERGYRVDLTELKIEQVYAGLAKGNPDLFLDAWLPSTHAEYWNRYGSQLEDLGTWYEQGTLHIAVPNYLTGIDSIADLKGKAGMFGGEITGIDEGAGLSRATEEAITAYGLRDEYRLKNSSTTTMLAELQKATDARRPIAVTLWHPHWAYARYPIKDLRDPRGAMGGAEQLHAVGRAGFGQDHPEVARMLEDFQLTDRQITSLENEINNARRDREQQAAQKWAEAHPEVAETFGGE